MYDLDQEIYVCEDPDTGYMKVLKIKPKYMVYKESKVLEENLDDNFTVFMDSKVYDALLLGLIAKGFAKE